MIGGVVLPLVPLVPCLCCVVEVFDQEKAWASAPDGLLSERRGPPWRCRRAGHAGLQRGRASWLWSLRPLRHLLGIRLRCRTFKASWHRDVTLRPPTYTQQYYPASKPRLRRQGSL